MPQPTTPRIEGHQARMHRERLSSKLRQCGILNPTYAQLAIAEPYLVTPSFSNWMRMARSRRRS